MSDVPELQESAGRARRTAFVRPLAVCALMLVVIASASGEPFVRLSSDSAVSMLTRLVASPAALSAPDDALPGDLVRVYAAGDAIDALELVSEDGRVVLSAPPIRLSMANIVRATAFLIGLDSTLEPGEYTLRGIVNGEAGPQHALTIGERAFRTSEFSLTPALTTLRAEPDPEKDRQTRALTALILSRDPDAIYHTGPLHWPLPATTRRTGLFGDRRVYLYSTGARARTVHVGLDLAAPTGTPVHSSGNGIVRMTEFRIVTGGTVVIEHLPGVFTLYYHLDEVSATDGSIVAAGDPIGTVGATGLATGPHLHWEVRVNGVPISPEELTERGLLSGIRPSVP
ncbi:MAG: M23 family metallopeptidase [Spirochaetaceae bacterium]|nr:MAG: M23 family metallopeptidase [Spirochaetaceae bacterium]